MKRFHVKNSMKKMLAFSLAAAVAVPGILTNGSISASAEASVPEPAKYFSMDKGFAKEGLTQTKFGQMIGWIEDTYPAGHQYAGLKYFNPSDGRLTGQFQEVDTVLVQGSWVSDQSVGHKGYQQAKIPAGEKKQYLPDIATTDGSWIQFSPCWNQPTTACDKEKGMVFWLDNTLENESYPTYATTVDRENGTWTTDMSKIVKDTKGRYQEFDINNSAAEFENPFAGKGAAGLTFSAWIKNTTPYKKQVVYGMLGDLNGNEGIDTDDALAELKHVASVEVLSENGKAFADVDGSGGVTTDDALDILKFVANIITEFTGTPPVVDGEDENVPPLEDSEFFHVERRVIGKTLNSVTNKEEEDERNIQERQYLYFSGNGVTYVGDFTDPESACTWTLDETLKGDETVDLLSGKNGSAWKYVSYTFDGEDFHMYLDEKEVPLVKKAGSAYSNDIMAFVGGSSAKTYLGGRGGGVKGNFNTFAVKTSDDYYMDDVAVYTSALDEEQIKKAFADAKAKEEAVQNKQANVLKTFSFEGGTLEAAQLEATGVSGSKSEYQPDATVEGKSGKGLQIKRSYQAECGGARLKENPFAGKSDLTGVTISYWMKSIGNKRGVVTDGVLLSFIDENHECTHEKVTSDAYLGANAMAKSQLYINQAFIASFCEGATKPVGANSLKNIYNYAPYKFGDPETLEQWKKQFEIYDKVNNVSYYDDWKKFRNDLAKEWNFVTVTFNNAGFVMYLNGKEVKNRKVDFKGERFCDYYWGRTTEITRKATNNGGARSLMDFMTAADTKVYLGFGYEQSSETSFLTASDCYLDELTFYDKDMTAAEVQALYNSVK